MVVNSNVGLELDGICKSFGSVVAADRIDLLVSPGELVSLLGPSGCGKTTTLRIIGGFVHPDRGEVYIGGERVTDLPANRRQCGFVFQSYALFPHMTVFDNIAYGLKLQKFPAEQIAGTVSRTVSMLNLSGTENRYPKQLSGGQQQRVAIARALAINPRLFLLDEPLSNLDAKLRERVRFELRALQKETGITTIFVTHDQSEAMVLSDRIAVMNCGRIEQLGTPTEVYYQPRTKFVADFIGQNNFIEGRIVSADPAADSVEIEVGGAKIAGRHFEGVREGQMVVVCVRPECIELRQDLAQTPRRAGRNILEGKITLAAFLGSEWRYEVYTDAAFTVKVRTQSNQASSMSVGDRAVVAWEMQDSNLVVQ